MVMSKSSLNTLRKIISTVSSFSQIELLNLGKIAFTSLEYAEMTHTLYIVRDNDLHSITQTFSLLCKSRGGVTKQN